MGNSAADAQNRELYGAEGQYNPKLARAQRKKAKKAKGASDEDYDFDEAFGEGEDTEME